MSKQRLQELESYLKTRRQSWPYEGRYSLEPFGEHRYIAKIDSELAGLSWAEITAPGEAALHMNLKKEYAEYGIGTELLETLMDDLQNSDFEVIRYDIDMDHYAYQIYHNMGFEVEGRSDGQVRLIWRNEKD